MIVIIDYGVGNLRAIGNMLKRIGVESVITANPNQISSATKLILSGVGSFDHGMDNLRSSGVLEILNEKVLIKKTPVLGICLGVQLMTESSEEGSGEERGLGWVKGKTVAFDRSHFKEGQKVPHMGWANIFGSNKSKLFHGIESDARFYFVHSYHLDVENPGEVIARANYGYPFVAGVERENIVGVQFHPEKSHRYGLQLLKNFVNHY